MPATPCVWDGAWSHRPVPHLYLDDCHIAPINDDAATPGGVRSYALDPEAAKRLWAVSEEMVGQSFPV